MEVVSGARDARWAWKPDAGWDSWHPSGERARAEKGVLGFDV